MVKIASGHRRPKVPNLLRLQGKASSAKVNWRKREVIGGCGGTPVCLRVFHGVWWTKTFFLGCMDDVYKVELGGKITWLLWYSGASGLSFLHHEKGFVQKTQHWLQAAAL